MAALRNGTGPVVGAGAIGALRASEPGRCVLEVASLKLATLEIFYAFDRVRAAVVVHTRLRQLVAVFGRMEVSLLRDMSNCSLRKADES